MDSTYGLDPAPLRRIVERQARTFSCCVVFAAMEVTAGLITCICFPECPSMKKQFGQWNVIRIAGTVMSAGAMYVLCTLHSVITRPEVEKFVGGMNPVQRRVLLRYIARQGYSRERFPGIHS
ncbi:MAG: hypothetical protein V8Q38_01410 [Alistipes putredinis]